MNKHLVMKVAKIHYDKNLPKWYKDIIVLIEGTVEDAKQELGKRSKYIKKFFTRQDLNRWHHTVHAHGPDETESYTLPDGTMVVPAEGLVTLDDVWCQCVKKAMEDIRLFGTLDPNEDGEHGFFEFGSTTPQKIYRKARKHETKKTS